MKRYAVCGVSNRAIGMFIKPLLTTYSNVGRLVGLLDIDPVRFEVCAAEVPETRDVPSFDERSFDAMIAETRPDVIIVAGRDDTHVTYILAALQHDLDVIVEKPMVTRAADARRVIDAEAASQGSVRVTFNCRYPAVHRRIKEMILAGAVGRITSVDLNWYVDTYHGASYFKRWNRRREYSGGLSVHKCCHHFDWLNWLIGQEPIEVFAFGSLNYYGPDSEMNPRRVDGRHCETCVDRPACKYYMRWSGRAPQAAPPDDHLGAGKTSDRYTDYRTDSCIFDSEINIEDTYTATIRYAQGAQVSYSANYSCPYEGYRLAVNGTCGRIETLEYHSPARCPFPTPVQTIDYFPLFGGAKETIHVLQGTGGHGGGDPVILEDLFLGPDPQRGYPILAGAGDGARAVAVGEAVWRSAKTGKPVQVSQLLA